MTTDSTTAHLTVTRDASRAVSAVPVEPARGTRRGVRITDVVFDRDGFWGKRQEANATATFAHCIDWMERLGWLENFDRVARGDLTVDRDGWQFSDSEVYKLIEALAWELARLPDPVLQSSFDALVARIAAAQDADGYLNTAFGHPGLPDRYSDMSMGHELYNAGHLLQAAVAGIRTRNGDALVEIATRVADHICETFAQGRNESLCGHPEIEVALAEFGRATGRTEYTEQARIFLERRGRGTLPVRPLLSADYFQDDVPVREADALRGHAVRALYLSAGAVDVAVDTGDDELFVALQSQWRRTVERRTYITGGMGSRHQDEGFGEDWELPADRAYCETCAGVASVMLSWRLYLATGDVAYVDLIERTLFNIIATSPAEDGKAFFYANTLHQREAGEEAHDRVNHRAEGGVRAPWFDVSCCPTNVARTLASLGAYTAATDRDEITILQYSGGLIRADLESGPIQLRVETRYPDNGPIRVTVVEAPYSPIALRLRVPGWADGATLRDGERTTEVLPGWGVIQRTFRAGDTLELDLGAALRVTWPDRRIDAVSIWRLEGH